MKLITCILLMAAAFIAGGFAFRGCDNLGFTEEATTKRDTVRVRDTVRLPVPEPIIVEVVRCDTVHVRDTVSAADTLPHVTPGGDVVIPITQKTYATEDYRATVEGYRPRLVDIEVYPLRTTITNTVTNTVTKHKRWAFTVGPGFGYGPTGFQPYVGVHFGFVIWSF